MSNSVEVWLWLLMVMQPHNPDTHIILEKYDYNAVEAAKAIRDGEVPNLSQEITNRAKVIRNNDVQQIIKICADNGVSIVTIEDDIYPKSLKNIYNPPIVLFVVGNIEGIDDKFSISVIGSRNASQYAYQVTRYIVAPLSRVGTVIVSGLANGIDSAAHNTCVDNGGCTIGVCACGILTDYPRGSGFMKRRILENGGALISELLPFDKTSPQYFKYRNRLVSGLSLGTLVVESGEKSGCFLTVAHALEQGKEVFAVPPCNIMNSHYSGTSSLLRDGAIPVFDYTDILYAFELDGVIEINKDNDKN